MQDLFYILTTVVFFAISIPVDVSSAYKASASVEQGYVTFLGSLIHGAELRTLRVFIASPKQIQGSLCGSGALACYDGNNQTMYVPGSREERRRHELVPGYSSSWRRTRPARASAVTIWPSRQKRSTFSSVAGGPVSSKCDQPR